jgi:UDP-N-acetyl-D-mannosaminuronate dehydrogenase
MEFETISVIGLGYIGLPTAAAFAARRKTVIGVDVNSHAVDTINRGEIHIVEPELDMLVHAAVTQGHLRGSNTLLGRPQTRSFLRRGGESGNRACSEERGPGRA